MSRSPGPLPASERRQLTGALARPPFDRLHVLQRRILDALVLAEDPLDAKYEDGEEAA